MHLVVPLHSEYIIQRSKSQFFDLIKVLQQKDEKFLFDNFLTKDILQIKFFSEAYCDPNY